MGRTIGRGTGASEPGQTLWGRALRVVIDEPQSPTIQGSLVFVVVAVVRGVTMLAVHEIDVVGMRHRVMAAFVLVDVHVGAVRDVDGVRVRHDLIHVSRARVMDIAVMEEVDVILVR